MLSRTSPHKVLCCSLKSFTASAHLTFSEASPPTCKFPSQTDYSYNHGMVWVERDLKVQVVSGTPLTIPGFSEPCPAC